MNDGSKTDITLFSWLRLTYLLKYKVCFSAFYENRYYVTLTLSLGHQEEMPVLFSGLQGYNVTVLKFSNVIVIENFLYILKYIENV